MTRNTFILVADTVPMPDPLPCMCCHHQNKSHHRKQHFFDYKNGLPVVHGDGDVTSRSEAAQDGELSHRTMNHFGSPTRGSETLSPTKEPRFVALDRKVLRFEGWFKEHVPEAPGEEHRIRKCILYYYLVDDSIRIAEPRVENSGLPQGSFLKRHKIPTADGFLGWDQLVVGQSVDIYGRELKLANCDEFTREFMKENGIDQPAVVDVPADPYTTKRDAGSASNRMSHKAKQEDQRWRFLQYNRKVLRFYCAWDDRDALYGERRCFILHYFMEDQTVEILETQTKNSGRDAFPRMLSRQKLPKQYNGLADMDSKDNLTDADLTLGSTVTVFGRNFFLYDCDDSTKEYYRERYGVTEFPDLTATISDRNTPLPRMAPPPYTGFGTLEDSLGSFYNLVPKVPRRDVTKAHMDGMMMRWQAKFKEGTCSEQDADRRFVITFYLGDDTISIFEPPQKNSGQWSGKFLERGIIYKPSSGARDPKPQRYAVEDFSVNAELKVHSHIFSLLDCDDYTKKFLETGKPQASAAMPLDDIHKQARRIISKKKAQFNARFRECDKRQDGTLLGEEFVRVVRDFGIEIDDNLVPQFLKFWNVTEEGYVNYIEFCDMLS